jgi:predicted transcriptional regulator of viral defense system
MKTLPILFKYESIKELYPSVTAFYAFVGRATKRGELKQIKRGLYALVNPSTGHIFATKFQIASHLFNDAYFSYHEALEYYGLTNQSFVSSFTYLTHVYVDYVEFEDVIYRSKKSGYDLEVLNRMQEEDVRVVSLERAIVDSIDSPSLGGGLEEIEYALSNCRTLKIDKIEMLLKHFDKAFLYQKVGYLFEKHFGDEVPESFYKLCLAKIGNKINYFESKVGYSKLILKWRLMVSEERNMPDELF